jgi:hypothetical protein
VEWKEGRRNGGGRCLLIIGIGNRLEQMIWEGRWMVENGTMKSTLAIPLLIIIKSPYLYKLEIIFDGNWELG